MTARARLIAYLTAQGLSTARATANLDELLREARSEPLVARWDRTVIHPASPGDEETIVCCLTDDGQPIALILDDEYREALGMQLVDPDGDGETVIPPHAAEKDIPSAAAHPRYVCWCGQEVQPGENHGMCYPGMGDE